MKKLKIAFIPTNVSGVMFYRCWQPAEAMRALGHKVAVLWYSSTQILKNPWEWDMTEPGFEFIAEHVDMACEWADIIVWMQLNTDASMNLFKEMRIKYHDKPMVMELDDYIFLPPVENAAFEVYQPGSLAVRLTTEQISLSDAMIVSTPYLSDMYRPYARSIYVVENAIDLSLWRVASSTPRRRVNLGWVGGASHMEDLRMIKDAVYEVLAKYKHVRFVCLHGFPKEFEEHRQIICPRKNNRLTEEGQPLRDFKTIGEYPKWVSSYKFDIGLAPLQDNNFTRAKSNLRWLEYSAMGIPTIASPLPHFRQSIDDRNTGFIASTNEEWVNCLSDLIESSYLRKTIGANAKSAVKENWSPKKMASKYLTVLQEIANAKSDTSGYSDEGRRPDQRSEQSAMDGGAEAESNSSFHGAVC